jgi:hypothetical protein
MKMIILLIIFQFNPKLARIMSRDQDAVQDRLQRPHSQ